MKKQIQEGRPMRTGFPAAMLVILVFAMCLGAGCGGGGAETSRAAAESQDQSREQILTWQEQYDLGIRLLEEGNYEEAILAFTAAIEIDPRQGAVYAARGDAYSQMLDALIQQAPGAELSQEARQAAENAAADYRQAAELLEEMEGTDSGAGPGEEERGQLSEIYDRLADVYEQLGDIEGAMEALRDGYEATGEESLMERYRQLEEQTILVMSSQMLYRADGELAAQVIYDYDGQGYLIRYQAELYGADGAPETDGSYSIEWSFVSREPDFEQWNVILRTPADSEGMETPYYYPDGRPAGTTDWYAGTAEICANPYLFQSGETAAEEIRNTAEQPGAWLRAVCERDEMGQVQRIYSYDEAGELLGSCEIRYERLYSGRAE